MFDHLDAAPDFTHRVIEDLAGFPAQAAGDVLLVALQQFLVREEYAGTFRHRSLAPPLESGLGALDGAVHLRAGRERHFAEHFLGGGVGDRNPVRLAVDELAVDE